MEKLKNWFAQLTPKKKMAYIWIGILGAVVIVIFATNDEPIVQNIQELVTENERGIWGENQQEVTLEGLGTQQAALLEQISVVLDRDAAQNQQILELREAIRDFSNSEENIRNIYELNRKMSTLEKNLDTVIDKLEYGPRQNAPIIIASEPDDDEDMEQEEPTSDPSENEDKPKRVPSITPTSERRFIKDEVTKTSIPDDPLEFIQNNQSRGGTRTPSEENLYIQNGAQSTQLKPNKNAIQIVTGDVTAQEESETKPSDNYVGRRVLAGSLIPVTVITGVEAPTGKAAESGAVSSTLRINGPAILPNGYRLDLTGCVVTNNVKGQINTERAYFRPDRLSCQFEFGEVDIPIKGYVTGKDGTQGFRGKVISKQGKALLYGSIAGGVEGIGDAFGGGNQNTTLFGGADPFALPESSAVMRSGASSAVSESADFLKQYYQDKLEQLHEVVEVKPLITGSIHILETFQLELLESIEQKEK